MQAPKGSWFAGRQNIQITHVYAAQAVVGDVVQGGNKNG